VHEPVETGEPENAALSAGLHYVSDSRPGITRRKAGRGFLYTARAGAKINDPQTLARIHSLAIPPAWTDVWICPRADGHIQATGRDVKGRKQYCYHPRFREIREEAKYEHIFAFADALPLIRTKVSEHMALPGLGRQKVLATVVYLLERTLIRIGSAEYTKQNNSYGLTTLKSRHATVNGSEIRFRFVGKSGKEWSVTIADRRVSKIIKSCQDLPGQDLLQYVDEEGERQHVTSSDVNEYLKEMTGREITAKDFRTWAGTVMAALALDEMGPGRTQRGAKRKLMAAIEAVADRLGNTRTICRKCYVHPAVTDAYLAGELKLTIRSARTRSRTALRPEEKAVLRMLRKAA
jgi:DNA topoisomerase-1